MYGKRIEMAKNSLKLFMRSLPSGCMFSIISFGSDFKIMTLDGEQIIPYNNQTQNQAIAQIDTFDNDMGGTELLMPLVCAQTQSENLQFIKKYGSGY